MIFVLIKDFRRSSKFGLLCKSDKILEKLEKLGYVEQEIKQEKSYRIVK